MTSNLQGPPGYERTLLRELAVSDLEGEAMLGYARERVPSLAADLEAPELARHLGLAGLAGRDIVPTVAGYYCFGKRPQLLKPEWGVAAVRVDGRVLADPLIANRSIEGAVQELLQGAMDFVERHTQVVADQVDKTPAHEYPVAALREALTNALVHRDLRMPARVSVSVFDDRVEVWSPGKLQTKLELDVLAQLGGLSLPRNPLVAALARGFGMVDQLGRGLPIIRRTSQAHGGSGPTFCSDDLGVRVTIPSSLRRPARAGRGLEPQ